MRLQLGRVLWKSYLLNDLLDELGQSSVDEVSDDTNTLGSAVFEGLLDKSSHILLQHSLDILALLLVLLEDGLATEQATLLGTVPVELDRVGRLAINDILGVEERTEDLHDGNGTTSIIISTGSGEN